MKTEIQQLIQQAIKSAFGMDFDVEKIKVDYPPEGMGDFSTNVALLLAKEIGKSPMEVAEELRDKIALKDVGLEKVEVALPGFLNLYLAEKAVQEVIAEINEKGSQFGNLEKKNEKIMIEYSQPNTHKEFHIGHLRNVFIGSTLVNVLKKAGSDVIAANYIGDTGTHIAKCLWGLVKFHPGEDLSKIENKTEFLGKVYSEAVQKIESDEKYKDEFKQIQKRLEDGDEEIVKLWKETRQWSLDEFSAIYKELGVSFDEIFYESEEEIAGKKMLPNLLEKGVAKKSQGAVIADLEEYDLGVLVLQRGDGSVLYGLKDIPLAIEKFEKYKIDGSVIVADVRQSLYFRQIFKILEQMGFEKKMVHIGYEFVALKGGESMSSRKGNVVPAQYLIAAVANEVKRKFPETDISSEIGLGAVKFFMLKYSSGTKIDFDINESVKIEGTTGPYVQYAHARIASILQKASLLRLSLSGGSLRLSLSNVSNKRERALIFELLKFPDLIEEISRNFEVHHLSKYATDLADKFHSFYNDCKVIDETNPELTAARLELVKAVQIVLAEVLRLMGISAPDKM
ncbi:MAG TPA: arginine--tRNA ligase [Candidatus Saccharimonadales bacterium]|nr:arginine--tRNA ligase [Candidatus Saccharimonadales bacterium]